MTKKEKIRYLENKVNRIRLKDSERDIKREKLGQEIKSLKGWEK